ncbi:MAG: hypothetical protein QOK43_2035 [Acidimicrobiaceae bacterium]|nr:hypothetical protein [Acidimicrobiaceae bacterium]
MAALNLGLGSGLEPPFDTLRVEGTEWRHHARLHAAFAAANGARSTGSTVAAFAAEGDAAAEGEEQWRMWVAKPDRMRVEFALGREQVTAVFEADRWWSWSPSSGERTNAHATSPGGAHGRGPGEVLVDPRPIVPTLDMEVLGPSTFVGRSVSMVRAVPVRPADPAHGFALHSLGSGADEYGLLVDDERGVLLRSEARRGGEAFRVVEVTAIEFDRPVPASVFTPDWIVRGGGPQP